jgi:hypothetical protein
MTLSSSSEIRALVEATMQKRFPEEFQVNGQ